MVLEADLDAVVLAQVLAAELVGGVGRLGQGDEPLRVLDHPARIDAHVVGHHVRRQPDAPLPGPVAQVCPRGLATQVPRDHVVVQGVRRRRRIRVAAPDLDPPARVRALPEADEPEAGDPQPCEPVQLVVGDRVQRPDVALVPARQLVQPDVRALRDEDQARHPGGVAREALRLRLEPGQVRRLAAATAAEARAIGASAPAAEPPVEPALLLGHDVERQQHPVQERVEGVTQQLAPVLPHVAQLAGERRRVRAGRGPQQLHQGLAARSDGRLRRLVVLQ